MDRLSIHAYILDDDQDTLDLIREEFDTDGISKIAKLEFFRDPEKFLGSLKSMNIGILDQNLGGPKNGFDIVEAIDKHNRHRETITKIRTILMSGTSDIDVPIYYLNQQKIRFYVRKKNDYGYLKILAEYTQIAIEEVIDDMYFEERHNGRRERAGKMEEMMKNLLRKYNETK